MGRKPEVIKTRCEPDTKQRWASFAILFDDYEEALNELLDEHEEDVRRKQRNLF